MIDPEVFELLDKAENALNDHNEVPEDLTEDAFRWTALGFIFAIGVTGLCIARVAIDIHNLLEERANASRP